MCHQKHQDITKQPIFGGSTLAPFELFRPANSASLPSLLLVTEGRVSLVRELADHLEKLLAGREIIHERLQPPQSYLLLDTEFQEQLVQVFPSAIHSMAQLAEWLEALEWAGQYHVGNQELKESLATIPETLTTYQRHMAALQDMRAACRNLKEATTAA